MSDKPETARRRAETIAMDWRERFNVNLDDIEGYPLSALIESITSALEERERELEQVRRHLSQCVEDHMPKNIALEQAEDERDKLKDQLAEAVSMIECFLLEDPIRLEAKEFLTRVKGAPVHEYRQPGYTQLVAEQKAIQQDLQALHGQNVLLDLLRKCLTEFDREKRCIGLAAEIEYTLKKEGAS